MCFYLGKPARWSAGLISPTVPGCSAPSREQPVGGWGGEGKRLPWGAQASCRRALGLRTSRPSAGWVKPVLHREPAAIVAGATHVMTHLRLGSGSLRRHCPHPLVKMRTCLLYKTGVK